MSGKASKKSWWGGALILTALAFLTFPTCEIGLGKAVDVEAPVLEITQPTSETAPIRGAFKIRGTCKDDGEIGSIAIDFYGIDSGKNDGVKKSYTADIIGNPKSGSMEWECEINPKDANDGVLDGSYQLVVAATDTFGHVTYDKVSFTVDNTSPILVLTRPSTIFDAISPDTYGQEFTLEGQSADNSDVGMIEVKIYSDPDCEESSYKDTITLSKVPPTVSQTVMQWAAEDGAYKKLYGNEMTGETKNFYCTLVVYDDARPCPDEGEGAGKGNSADYYYLYNDIYDDVLSEFKLTQVYSILNGTYTSSESNRAVAGDEKVSLVKKVLGDGSEGKRTIIGSFALNPLNNPKFSISGYDPLKKNEGEDSYNFEDNVILLGSDITVQVSSGLDKIPLDDDTIGIYAVQVSDNLEPEKDAEEKEIKITLLPPACKVEKDGNGNRIKLIEDEDKLAARTALIKTVGSYDRTISITLNKDLGFNLGKNYIIEVVGCDKKDNKFFNNDDNYGFTITSEGTAPTLEVEEPKSGLNYIGKNTGKLVIKGTTTLEGGNPSLTISNGNVKILEDKEITDEDGKFTEEFNVETLIKNKLLKENDNTLTIVSSYDGRRTTVQRTVIYDAEDPEINVTSVSPVVESFKDSNNEEHANCVNGEIKIKGTLSDNKGIASAAYVVKGKCKVGNEDKTVIIASGDLDKSTSFTITADTTKGETEDTKTVITRKDNNFDNCDLTVEITATDLAGNKTEFALKTSEDKPYYICQESDRPIIKPTNFESDKENDQIGIVGGESVNLFGTTSNNTLNATIEDDDGINSVTVKYKLDGFSATGDDGVITKTFTPTGTPTTYSLKCVLDDGTNDKKPLADGKYEVKIEIEDVNVEDTNTLSSSEITTWIGVSAGAPTVTINSPASNQWYAATGDNSISPTFTLTSNTLTSVVRKIEKVTTSAAGTTYTEVSTGTKNDIATTATSDSIALTSVHTGEGNSGEAITGNTYRVTYTATDMFRQTGTASFTYRIDNTAPVTTSATLTTSKGALDASVWFNTTTIGLTGTGYSDGTSGSCSGLESFDYWITDATVSNISSIGRTGNVPASGTGFKTSIDVAVGKKKIWIQAIDNVGNKSVAQSYDLNIDTTDPNMSLSKVDGQTGVSSKLVNGSNAVTFVVSASDEGGSDVYSVKFETTELTEPNAKSDGATANDVYEFTIPTTAFESGGSLASGGPVKVTVTDNAGNKTTDTLFSIELDKSAPKATFASHSENEKVNKTITLTGTVTDDQKIDYITLEVSTDNGSTYTKIGDTSDTTSYPLTLDGSAWSKEINTTEYDNAGTDKTVTFRLTAYDTAGNSAEETLSLIVNQNTDRPEITFNGLELSGMTDINSIWLKGSLKIRGTITDDDGTISEMRCLVKTSAPEAVDNTLKASIKAGTQITVKNGSWEAELKDQGAQTVYFYVKDAKGGEFYSSAADEITAVYLSDGTNTFGKDTNATTRLYLQADTNAPEAVLQGASVKEVPAEEDWVESYSSMKLGGATTTFKLRLKAKDANGIADVSANGVVAKATLKNASGTEIFTKDYTAVVDTSKSNPDSDGYTWYKFDGITCAESITLDGKHEDFTGTMEFKVTVTDKAGLSKESSATFNVDNTAPVITVSNPSSSVTVSNPVSAYGTVDSSSKIYYTVSPSGTDKPSENKTVASWDDVDGNTTSIDSGSQVAVKEYIPIENATLSWSVAFTGTTSTPTATYGSQFTTYLIDYGITTNDKIISTGNDKFDSIVKLYLWIKAVDECGNVTETPHLVLFDPQGDRPTVSIDSLEKDNNSDKGVPTVGGGIKLFGAVNDPAGTNIGVKSVWVQLISEKNGAGYGTFAYSNFNQLSSFELTSKDLDFWNEKYGNVYKMSTYDPENKTGPQWTGTSTSPGTLGSDKASDYAILATSNGSSWSLRVNDKSELNPENPAAPKDYKANEVAVRVYAIDGDKKVSIAANAVMKVDAQNPILGDPQPLYLVQSSSGAFSKTEVYTASKEYKDDMYVKGQWYLIGSVKDDTIKSLIIGDKDLVSNSSNAGGSSVIIDDSSVPGSRIVYFKYKLQNPAEIGESKFTITAVDTSDHTTTKTITINHDNKAPELYTNTSDKKIYNISGDVVQSNSFYTFGSRVSEPSTGGKNQSGFSHIAFYFLRRNSSSNWNRIYNPLRTAGGSGNYYTEISSAATPAPTTDGAIYYNSGLYWLTKTVTRNESNLGALTLESANENIHKNGLVMIGGSTYLISAVDGKSVTLDGNPDKAYTVAYFALASIVDNTVTEASSGNVQADGYYEKPVNDDGDRMVESVSKSGADWTWEASICSRNIPDGPIELHYVAFDKAGNYSIGIMGNVADTDYKAYTTPDAKESYSLYDAANAAVRNNAPRIAGLKIGTDYNGDGSLGESEWNTEYSALNNFLKKDSEGNYITSGGRNVYDYEKLAKEESSKEFTVGGAANPVITFKGYSEVKLEIVGGNGSLYYQYDLPAGTNGTALKGNNGTTVLGTGSSDYTAADHIIKLQPGDLVKLGDSAGSKMTFTVWDSTESTTKFTDSNYATVNIYAGVQMADGIAPEAKIKPFHWKSAADNSLYGNSKDNGHIELEDDLTFDGSTFTGSSGLTDKDPKVSGKIVIKGTAYDNKRLKNLYLSVPGMTTQFSGAGCTQKDSTTFYLMSTHSDAGWTKQEKLDSNGFDFEVTDEKFDSSGHYVDWTFTWDTSKIANVAALDVKVQVMAEDEGKPTYTSYANGSGAPAEAVTSVDGTTKYSKTPTGSSGNKTSTPGSTQTALWNAEGTARGDETGYYQMDVVPYVTKVTTGLSSVYDGNASVYARTTLGNYPIIEGETIALSGFNLGTSPTVQIKATEGGATQNTTATSGTLDAESVINVTVAAETKSGELSVTVSSVSSINGLNNNEAEYNSLPNGVNNDLLKDDLMIDVWKYKTAATPRDGKIAYPEMKIGPSGEVGFAFVNGGFYFNMAGPAAYGENFDGTANSWASQRAYEGDYAIYYESALAFDVSGRTYGISTNEDSNNNFSAYTSFYFGQHATNTYGSSGYNARSSGNYRGGAWRRRLQSTTSTVVGGIQDTQVDRCQSPEIAVTSRTKGNGTNVYIAYYDSVRKEVRYRWGTFGTSLENKVTNVAKNGNIWTITTEKNHNFTDGTLVTFDWTTPKTNDHYEFNMSKEHASTYAVANASGNTFTVTADTQPVYTDNYVSAIGGQIIDVGGGWTKDSDQIFAYAENRNEDVSTRAELYSVIADSSSCGQYVSIGAVPGASAAANDTVVICWFDKAAKCLRYGYTTDPQKDDITLSYINGNSKIDSNAGQYCQLKVDAKGGIHIAYYDKTNSNLKYAYAPAYNSDFTIVTVDSFLNVGTNISLDVALDGSNHVAPYIGYYSQASGTAKVAYPVAWSAGVTSGETTVYPATLSGVVVNGGKATDMFSGNWEIACIPLRYSGKDYTPFVPEDGKVCVGVHKNWTTGVLDTIVKNVGTIGGSATGAANNGDSVDASRTGGNGTKNPGVAFVIDDDYSLQFAQKN